MKKLAVAVVALFAMSLFVGCSSCGACKTPKVKTPKCNTCGPVKAAPCSTCDR